MSPPNHSQPSECDVQLEKLLRVSNELIQALSRADIGDELLNKAIQTLSKLAGARYGVIALTNDGRIEHFATFGVDQKTYALIGQLPEGKDILGLSLSRCQPIRVDDFSAEPAAKGLPPYHPEIKSLLVVPITCNDHQYGYIYLSDKESNRSFSSLDEQIVCTFASSLALIIENICHKENQAKAASQIKLYLNVFKNSNEAIMITDASGKLLSVNAAFCKITGYSEAEVLNKTPRFLRTNRHSRLFYKELLAALKNYGYWHGELWDTRKNGEAFPAWVSFSAITNNGDQQPCNYIGLLTDTSERKHFQDRIQYLAYYDTITELPNRELFQDRVQQLLSLSNRSNHIFAVMVVDIDHFKNINDSMGHNTGNELLKLLASRFNSTIRKGDTIAHLSGDEFAITLSNLNRPESAAVSAKKILDALQEAFILNKQEVFVTASIGISVYPNDGDDAATLVKHAEAAMFYTKSRQRNAFQFYHSEINANTRKKLALETSLRHALERDEFALHYQPMVDLESWNITNAEALIRWHHPEQGLLMPDLFIPLLEESGLITQVGEWVLRHACQQITQWLNDGLTPPAISINLSPRQFDQAESIDNIIDTLNEYSHCLNYISVEITESSLMKDAERANHTLKRLKAMGVHIAVDDFGTGYSSLAYLSSFPIDTLKIDRSFISSITTSKNKAAITRSVIDLAHNLELKALAEGIETEEQLSYLRELGCNAGQGYLFSRPLDENAFTQLIERRDTIIPNA